MNIVFEVFGIDLYCFVDASGAVFLIFLAFENKLENKAIFDAKPDLEPWIW